MRDVFMLFLSDNNQTGIIENIILLKLLTPPPDI